ncbi:lipocalin family protein [Gemmobacter caeni]|nr:lipocalin family protein [Gemmobacter caeni]
MSRLMFALLLALSACAKTPEPERAFRNTAVPIYSSAVLDAASLAGRWQQVGTFAAEAGGCRGGMVSFGPSGAQGLQVEADLCLDGQRARYRGNARLVAPGRLQLEAAEGALAEPWWVLWADADSRTLVIGTPSGRMGFVLERGGVTSPDRLKAAREILDWNGYSLAGLQMF